MRKLATVLVFSCAALAPAALLAQTTSAQRAACTPDAFRLCASLIPDVGKIIPCLRSQKSSLSESCRAAFDAAEGKKPTATRSSANANPDMAAWCATDRSAARREDVWTAWCDEAGR